MMVTTRLNEKENGMHDECVVAALNSLLLLDFCFYSICIKLIETESNRMKLLEELGVVWSIH